jgi:hypothetical protein
VSLCLAVARRVRRIANGTGSNWMKYCIRAFFEDIEKIQALLKYDNNGYLIRRRF